jgi:hypothetical protein
VASAPVAEAARVALATRSRPADLAPAFPAHRPPTARPAPARPPATVLRAPAVLTNALHPNGK